MRSRQDIFQNLAAMNALPKDRQPPFWWRFSLRRDIRRYGGLGKIDQWLAENDTHMKTRDIKGLDLSWLPKKLR